MRLMMCKQHLCQENKKKQCLCLNNLVKFYTTNIPISREQDNKPRINNITLFTSTKSCV